MAIILKQQIKHYEDLPTIMLATGGTAGHIFPAEALVKILQKNKQRFNIYIVTDKRGYPQIKEILNKFVIFQIHAAGIVGRKPWQIFIAGFQLLWGGLQSRRLLKKLKPDIVIGFGGYSSLPTMFVANAMKFPTMIHEQNALLGRANRLLAPGMDYIATAFEMTDGIPESFKRNVSYTGNPVRADFIKKVKSPYPTLDAKKGKIRILIIGGSQGAQIFGDKLPHALAQLPDEIKKRLDIVQQVRAEQLPKVRKFYKKHGIKAETASFFDKIAQEIAKSHLIICRSGAATLAEITTIGRPAIFVPYLHAADDHQMINASRITDAGGGWTIPQTHFNSETLCNIMMSLFTKPYRLQVAAKCAGKFGNPNAAENMASLVFDCLNANQTLKRGDDA